MSGATWWAALSGGVDSAVAALLTLREGRPVAAVTLRFLDSDEQAREARRVADALGIEHRVIDMRKRFAAEVIEPFIDAYAAGRTPNPCIGCNETMKFGALLEWVRDEGGAGVVTGHYARVVQTSHGSRIARAEDDAKDQSYFLYRLRPSMLERVRLPLGGLTKAEVRAEALLAGLPAAGHPESQDVCFLGGRPAGEYVCAHRPEACRPGDVVDLDGRPIGRHRGICHYTPGQRKGLPAGEGPLYVVSVDAARNVVVAGPVHACESAHVEVRDVVWHGGPEDGLSVKVRARMPAVGARVVRSAGALTIDLDEPVCAAPGQAAVCYAGDVVVGGGTIAKGSGR